MSTPRDLYNQYHKAMMDARIEANKQLAKDAMKRYEIDQRAKAYSDKNATEQKRLKDLNRREYYKIYVDAMGKMAEFDGKNPMHQIEKEGEGKDAVYYIGVGEERQEISSKAYLQYNQENLNTIKLRNLVMGGYIQGIKNGRDYDPDQVQRALNEKAKNPNNPPSGVIQSSDGTVKIKDKNDGVAKDIKQKTDEDLADETLDLEGEEGSWFSSTSVGRGIERDLNDPNSPTRAVADWVNNMGTKPGTGDPGGAVGEDSNRFGGTLYTDPASSTSTSGVLMNQAGKPMTTQEGMGNILNKGGINAGSPVGNSGGFQNSPLYKAPPKSVMDSVSNITVPDKNIFNLRDLSIDHYSKALQSKIKK